MPDVPGIEHVISSNEALNLRVLPKKIIIVGAGYIAVEFAGIFQSLGVDVTLVLRADKILRGFDEDVRVCLAAEMRKRGITLKAESVVHSIEKRNDSYSMSLVGGDVLGSTFENDLFSKHKIMVPPRVSGRIVEMQPAD